MTRWLRFIALHRSRVLTLHLTAALFLFPGLLSLRSDNSPHVFFPRQAKALADYQMFHHEFGGGQAVRVTVGGAGLWTREGLGWVGRLEEKAAVLETVRSVDGPVGRARWSATEWPPASPELFRDELRRESRGYLKGWISPDADWVSLLVGFDAPVKTAAADTGRSGRPTENGGRPALDRLMELVATPPPGVTVRVTGLPVLERAMDQSVARAVSLFFPLLILVAIAFLLALFRNLRDLASPLVFVGLCLVVVFGLMGYAGVAVNLINVLLAPLLFVIALATAMHILMHVQRLRSAGLDSTAALETTYRSKGWPVFWTGLTTFAAFGSLVTARLPVLVHLGLWAATGIAVMTILVFTVYPALLLGGERKSSPGRALSFDNWASGKGRALARWAVRHRPLVALFTVFTLAAGVWGISRIRVEDNVAAYLPVEHPVRRDLVAQESSGLGVFPADLVLSFRDIPPTDGVDDSGFQNPAALARLAELSALVRGDSLVSGAAGPGDLLNGAIGSVLVAGEVDDTVRWMTLGLLQTVPESRALLRRFLTADGGSARIGVLLPVLNFGQIGPLLERLTVQATGAFPLARTFVTGEYPLILQAQQQLWSGLTSSFSTTLLAVAMVFFLLLRHVRRSLFVLIPNLWPVVVALGAMGWLDVGLDSATVMTASIILGLAVDDTFHTLGHVRELGRHLDPETAIEETLAQTAPAQIVTSVILASGFAVCSLSELLPVSRFGAVAAFGVVLALLGDLLIVPALFTAVGAEPEGIPPTPAEFP